MTFESLLAVDSDVIPCTPAQSVRAARFCTPESADASMGASASCSGTSRLFKLGLIPVRHLAPGRHPVLDQEIPELWPFLREHEIGVSQPLQALLRRAGCVGIRQPVGQPIEQARLDRQQEVVEILKHVVERSRRVADPFGDFAGGQAFKAVPLDDLGRRLDDELTQFLGSMNGAPTHILAFTPARSVCDGRFVTTIGRPTRPAKLSAILSSQYFRQLSEKSVGGGPARRAPGLAARLCSDQQVEMQAVPLGFT